MGTDIHGFIECDEYPNWTNASAEKPKWRSYFDMETPCYPRTYSFWYALAGVRSGDVNPDENLIHRGVPKDSDPYQLERFGADHSVTWLTADELAATIERYEATEPHGYKAPAYFKAALAAMRELEKSMPTRIVIGFDS